jgi:hypothetical protein
MGAVRSPRPGKWKIDPEQRTLVRLRVRYVQNARSMAQLADTAQ